jgi:hypothetical protein
MRALNCCPRLTYIEVAGDNPNYCSVGGVLFSKDMTHLIAYPGGKEEDCYAVPGGVVHIDDFAFQGNDKLTKLILPDGITDIGAIVFSRCTSLTEISIPRSLISIDYYSFNETIQLSDVWYQGTEEELGQITLGPGNMTLFSATIHYALNITSVTANKTSATVGDAITWTAETTGGTGTLQYRFEIFKDGIQVKTSNYGSANTFTYTPAAAGTYTAKVYVKDETGSEVSRESDGVAVISTVPVLVSAAASAGQITVQWNMVANASKYAVYRKTAGGSWTLLTTSVTGTTYADTSSLTAGTTYYYTVK